MICSEWTKKEIGKITGLTKSQLDYLERLGWIQPIKIGSEKRPTVLYTWEMLVALQAYTELREECSLQTLRKAVDYLQLNDDVSKHIANKRLVALKNNIYWIDDEPENCYRTLCTGKHIGQIEFNISGNNLLTNIWNKGVNNVVNFAERAKEKPLEYNVA